MRKWALALAIAAATLFVGAASGTAAEYGTAAEAKAMLENTVAAVKAHKAKAYDRLLGIRSGSGQVHTKAGE